MGRLTIYSLEPVEVREYERARRRGPLWIERRDGTRERLTQRQDRSSVMVASLMIAGIWIVVAFCCGVVHGRANPIEAAPVADIAP